MNDEDAALNFLYHDFMVKTNLQLRKQCSTKGTNTKPDYTTKV